MLALPQCGIHTVYGLAFGINVDQNASFIAPKCDQTMSMAMRTIMTFHNYIEHISVS